MTIFALGDPVRRAAWLAAATLLGFQCAAQGHAAGQMEVPDAKIEERVIDLLRSMSLEQKVAQMTQADIRFVTPDDLKKYRIGSILNGGGAFPADNKHATVADWVALANRFYDASTETASGNPAIPVIWGTDAVHGHNNVIGATLFPHNIGLGAAHDPDLIERIGRATAVEVAATGIDWTFAPTVAVVTDIRWGRSYESYSERPELVKSYAARMVTGLQGTLRTGDFLDSEHILATAKHFIGDGGTSRGIDRGNTEVPESDLWSIHGQGFVSAVGAGVQTVMVSYNSWQGLKMHGQYHLITEVLKHQMGFDGIVVSDWDGIDEVQSCAKDRCSQAVNAGIDMFMVPELWRSFIDNTVEQVRNGDIPQSRIDDAVTRILRVKLRAGVFEKGRPSSRPLAGQAALIGAPIHRALAREAVRKSLVLLKNENNVLPLAPGLRVMVVGDGADNIGRQSGGWTLTWQGTQNNNADFPGATSVYEGIRRVVTAGGGTATLSRDGGYAAKPDVAIVVFGENPYAEWHGDIRSINFRAADTLQEVDLQRPAPESPAPGGHLESRGVGLGPSVAALEAAAPEEADLALMQKLRRDHIRVVSVFITGRPRGVTPELEASDAFLVAWLPGTEGAGVADILFRKKSGAPNFNFSGKLSFAWPRGGRERQTSSSDSAIFPYGFGLTYR